MSRAVKLDIVGFGEAMVLFQPAAGERWDTTPSVGVHVAGAELNVCAAAARLGATAGLCGRVGADPPGSRVLAEAARLGVDTTLVTVDTTHPTGVFLKDVRPDGQRRVYYYRRGSAASTMDVEDARRVIDARPGLVVVSGITLALGDRPRTAVTALLRGARPAGIRVAFDPNLRPALGPLDAQADAVRSLLSHVDYLLLGTDEAGPLFGVTDPAGVFRAAAAAGVGETVLKAGAEGCYHAGPAGRPVHLPSAAKSIVDPVGAGDAFAGGYLVGRLDGADPAGAAWLGGQLAAAVLAAPGDTDGLPDRETAAALRSAASRRVASRRG